MRVRFDRFYTHAALTEVLDAWAAEFPSLPVSYTHLTLPTILRV